MKGTKKKLKRTTYTKEQLDILEFNFQIQHYPSVDLIRYLSYEMGVKMSSIRVWFQNRRSKEKQKQNKIISTSNLNYSPTVSEVTKTRNFLCDRASSKIPLSPHNNHSIESLSRNFTPGPADVVRHIQARRVHRRQKCVTNRAAKEYSVLSNSSFSPADYYPPKRLSNCFLNNASAAADGIQIKSRVISQNSNDNEALDKTYPVQDIAIALPSAIQSIKANSTGNDSESTNAIFMNPLLEQSSFSYYSSGKFTVQDFNEFGTNVIPIYPLMDIDTNFNLNRRTENCTNSGDVPYSVHSPVKKYLPMTKTLHKSYPDYAENQIENTQMIMSSSQYATSLSYNYNHNEFRKITSNSKDDITCSIQNVSGAGTSRNAEEISLMPSFDTHMNNLYLSQQYERNKKNQGHLRQRINSNNPLSCAPAITYLCSNDSSYRGKSDNPFCTMEIVEDINCNNKPRFSNSANDFQSFSLPFSDQVASDYSSHSNEYSTSPVNKSMMSMISQTQSYTNYNELTNLSIENDKQSLESSFNYGYDWYNTTPYPKEF